MTFDYSRLFVISLLMLCILYYTKCEDQNTESDETTHLLKDYFSNEILTYLRLLKLENEQRLRQLSQNNPTSGQQYYLRDYAGSNWPYAPYNYDLDRLQDSYYSASYPGELAMWKNAAPSKMKFHNSLGVDQQPKILPPPIYNKEKFQNPMQSFPEFSYDANGILTAPIQTSYPLQFLDNNRYMPFYDINKSPTISYDQQGDRISSFMPNGSNFPSRQLPSGQRQLNKFQPGQQDEGAYRITSTISEPLEGSMMTSPPIPPQPTSGNVASIFDSISETIKNPNLRMFNVPNTVQATTNIDPSDSADSANNIQPNVRSLASQQKISDNNLSGNLGKDTRFLTGRRAMPTNRNYKVLIVDDEGGDKFTFEDVRKKLFWLQGLNPTGATKVMAPAVSGSSEGQPEQTVQTASIPNNEATFMPSPLTKSFINDSAGDGSIVTSVVEKQTRDLGIQYNNSGFGRFERGKNKGHITITKNQDNPSGANQGTPSASNQNTWIN